MREIGVTEVTCYRWRNRYGGLENDSGRVFNRVRGRDHPAAPAGVGSDIGKARPGGGDRGAEPGASCDLCSSCQTSVWHPRKACLSGAWTASIDPTQDTGAAVVGSAASDPQRHSADVSSLSTRLPDRRAGAPGQYDAWRTACCVTSTCSCRGLGSDIRC